MYLFSHLRLDEKCIEQLRKIQRKYGTIYVFLFLLNDTQTTNFYCPSPPQEPPEGPRSERKKQRIYATIYVSRFLLKDIHITHRFYHPSPPQEPPEGAQSERKKQQKYATICVSLFLLKVVSPPQEPPEQSTIHIQLLSYRYNFIN